MDKSSKPSEIKKRLLAVLRAARKQAGLTQQDVALRLGLHQSAYSRIESGSQLISAEEWFVFCDMTGAPSDCAVSGYIDHGFPTSLKSAAREGDFKIPSKYASNRATSVRSMLPLFNYFKKKRGAKALQTYLRNLRFDPDFFMVLENEVNIQLFLDMARELVGSGDLNTAGLGEMLKHIHDPVFHGKVHERYVGIANPAILSSVLVSNMKCYESNFHHEMEDDSTTQLELLVSPEPHLKEFDYRFDPDLGDMLCQYKRKYLESFLNSSTKSPVQVVHGKDCHFKSKKADKCVYRIQM